MVKDIKMRTKSMDTQTPLGHRPRSPSANARPAASRITQTFA